MKATMMLFGHNQNQPKIVKEATRLVRTYNILTSTQIKITNHKQD